MRPKDPELDRGSFCRRFGGDLISLTFVYVRIVIKNKCALVLYTFAVEIVM